MARGSACEVTVEEVPLGLGLVDSAPAARYVEVAVDAAGGGGSRAYTYHLPPALADIEPGEAVVVEYGRRQALAVVLGPVPRPPVTTKPVIDRVRADGPLLPPTTLALARWISATYLAPPALVIRAMLPPGFLERLELVAEVLPVTGESGAAGAEPSTAGGASSADPTDELLDALADGPRPVRTLRAPDGRAALLRTLRALRSEGRIALDWTLVGSGVGPRFERWVRLAAPGRAWLAGEASGRPLGPRQRAALDALAAAEPDGVAAPRLAEAHGASVVPGLVKRGLVEIVVRERVRDPLATRAPGLRGARPEGAPLLPGQREAVEAVRRAIRDGDPKPLLVDGVTGSGRTAVYVEAITASLEARPPGARARPRDCAGDAAGRPPAGRPGRRRGAASTPGCPRGSALDDVAADPRRAGRRRRRHAARACSRRSAIPAS